MGRLRIFDYASKRLRYQLFVHEKHDHVSVSADPKTPFGTDSFYEVLEQKGNLWNQPWLEYQSRVIDARALNELPDHTGQGRPAEVEFFAEPPREIGKVKSAESTLRPGRHPWPFQVRLLLGILLGGAIVFGGDRLGRSGSEIETGRAFK